MLKKKNLFKITIILIIILNICMPIIYADDQEEEELNKDELQEIVESATIPTNEPILNSKSAIIYDRTTKKVIWGKNEYKKRAMASTTKIITAIVVLENGGSNLKVKANDKLTINDLLYGLMLRSRK